jgi:hypothetical protein
MTDTNKTCDIFLSQKQLAMRWQMSESCVKNYRNKGLLPFFRLPQTSRVLYPLDAIERLEAENTQSNKKENRPKPEKQRKSPEVSSTLKWRI